MNASRTSNIQQSVPMSDKESGLTLIELLVAILISSVILLGITTLLASSAQTRNRVSNIHLLQEEATLASQILPQQLAQIGYRGVDTSLLDSRRLPITSLGFAFPEVNGEWAAEQTFKADSTSFSFRYGGASNVDGDPDGTIRTCIGDSVGVEDLAEVRIFLSNGALLCTDGVTTETLIGSANNIMVEQMIIELGVDNTDDRRIDTFKLVGDATDTDLLNTSLVRIRLLLATNDRAIKFNQQYYFNGATITATDNRIRQEIVVAATTRN